MKGQHDGEALAHLRWCDDLLRRHRLGGSALQQSALDDITLKIEDLEQDLTNPEIDLELRYLLLTHTRAMKQAVRDVPIHGRAGLEEVLDQALRDVYIRRNVIAYCAGPGDVASLGVHLSRMTVVARWLAHFGQPPTAHSGGRLCRRVPANDEAAPGVPASMTMRCTP